MMATRPRPEPAGDLASRLFATRKLTLGLAAPLSDADAAIQPFPDASPAKWHLAHTTWFFETFVLRDHVPDYRLFDDRWPYLFNSYYEGEGERHARPKRGMLSRPSLDQVRDYRAAVDDALERALPSLPPATLDLIELGIHHEQQHQELFLTDILATLAENPLEPAYAELPAAACFATEPLSWHRGRGGAPSSPRTSSPCARSLIANGASSSLRAATGRRRCGCRTAGPGSSRSGSARRFTGMRTAPSSPSPDAARSTGRRRSPTSAIMRPTPSRAGPEPGFRPRPSGRISRHRPIR